MLVIDAANVIGSRPTGWWRDRPGAAQRFVEQVRATMATGALHEPVTVVLEGQFRRGVAECDGTGAEASVGDGLVVVHAPREGDDTIAAIAGAHDEVVVVTADRGLAERVRAVGGTVVGPRWLLDRLVDEDG